MTPPIHLGRIPYLNCLLFFHALEGRDDVRLSPLVPSALGGAARESAVDAGPVPLVNTWEIEDRYMPLDEFCISVKDRAHSVLALSKVPLERLDGAEVGMTHQSSTSVRLLHVLLAHVWRVRPARFAPLDTARNDAYLLIGDDALRYRHGTDTHPHVADLGEVWQKWTGLPFVFARWMVRRDLPEPERRRLAALLDESIESGWPRLEEIGAEPAARLNMTIAEVREYLQGFRFRATSAEHDAMEKFRELDRALRGTEATRVRSG
ncbi:MAG TPA: menaquinone biosynthesis protein [Candidatus Krumholzibacteria bacterium]